MNILNLHAIENFIKNNLLITNDMINPKLGEIPQKRIHIYNVTSSLI